MPWLSLAASAGSTLLQSSASGKAADRQRAAAEAAAKLKKDQLEEGLQLQQPYYAAGTDALSQLQQRLPQLTAGYDPSRLLTEPGYQFGLDQGQQTLERSLAAKGTGVSGEALKRAAMFGTDYSTTKLGEAFNRDRATRMDAIGTLQGLAGGGQRAGEWMGGARERYAGNASADILGAANTGAANDIAQGNIWGNLLNQGASTLKGIKMPGGGGDTYQGAAGDPERQLRFFADGGAVRAEPRPGTRGPMRQGGGGGALSREAVLAALDAARVQPQQDPAQLQAGELSPFRNGVIPRVEMAVDRATGTRTYADGGAVKGKTGGKADKVSAKVSPGEHIFDAEVVAMLGDGNTEAGHKLLEELKARVRQYKRNAPPGRPAPSLELEAPDAA